jgi:glycosyltransferase involved in cell wall biosynthesis
VTPAAGIVVPVYNHGKTALPLAEKLARLNVPVILVDDGSGADTKAYLARAAEISGVVLITLEKNRGKGAAVFAGMDAAYNMGLTHALQIDADGQHDALRVPFFLEESARHPEAVICGRPEFDADAPAGRKHGRVVANTWTKIVTLSRAIPDSMCGFRVYPVEAVRRLARAQHVDPRMGFDIEIIVRLYWQRVPLVFYPVRVSYPKDGISHFHAVRDNFRIFRVFTRLCCGMFLRLPSLLRRNLSRRKDGC